MTDLRRIWELWGRLDVTVRDLPLGLLLLGGSLLTWFDGHGSQLGGMPTHSFDALAAVALALECLPLAVRRRWPVVCLALVSLGLTADQLRGYHLLAGAALLIALLSAGSHLARHRRATVLLLTAAYVSLAVVLLRFGSGELPGEFATFYLVLACAWGAGAWMRATRTTAAERRRRDAEETRATERTRIAPELHDVVFHHVTAMVVQVVDLVPRGDDGVELVQKAGEGHRVVARDHLGEYFTAANVECRDEGSGAVAPVLELLPDGFSRVRGAAGKPARADGDRGLLVDR